MDMPSVKDKVRSLVLEALDLHYISESCKDKIPTGNRYQTLGIGGERIQGFRSERRNILDRIDFQGKKVLDLGSNLGEMSRVARELGADLVDGYEYDGFFIEIASLVNALNGTTRVSFFQRDITSEATFQEEYDIILAFSVFAYIQPILAQVTACARQLLILETHALKDNLDLYLNAITPYLRAHRVLDMTDWGRNLDENTKRAIIAFAREESVLERLVATR